VVKDKPHWKYCVTKEFMSKEERRLGKKIDEKKVTLKGLGSKLLEYWDRFGTTTREKIKRRSRMIGPDAGKQYFFSGGVLNHWWGRGLTTNTLLEQNRK